MKSFEFVFTNFNPLLSLFRLWTQFHHFMYYPNAVKYNKWINYFITQKCFLLELHLIYYVIPFTILLNLFVVKDFDINEPKTNLLYIFFFHVEKECIWMQESHVDWIFQGPACAVLIINLIFLIRIMWVSYML